MPPFIPAESEHHLSGNLDRQTEPGRISWDDFFQEVRRGGIGIRLRGTKPAPGNQTRFDRDARFDDHRG